MHITPDEFDALHRGELSDADLLRIQTHLHSCPECSGICERTESAGGPLDSFLDSLLDSLCHGEDEEIRDRERELPFRLGEYQCLKKLGEGGLGVVFLAFDAKLGRDVAVKVIRPELIRHRQIRERFVQEARLAARCHHPNIVWIIHLGEEQDELYFAMQYVENGSLQERLSNARTLGCRESAELLKTLAVAVDYAHSLDGAGIIHRDLKPANILFTRDEVPKIADFGFAKRLEARGLTQHGAVIGTLGYMAPEQGQGLPATKRSDIYALGAILYRCLTGESPIHRAENDPLVVNDEAVFRDKLRASADRDLTEICLACLKKNADERYQRASGLASDLGRYLDGNPVSVRPPHWAENCLRMCRRNPWAAALFGAALILTLGALLMVSYLSISRGTALAREEHTQVRLRESLAGETRARQEAERAREELDDALLQAERDRDMAQDALARFRRANYALQVQGAASVLAADPGLAKRMLDDEVLCPKDLRDTAWRVLQTLCLRELEVWEHKTQPLCLACCPQRRLFATGDQEGKVRLWLFGAGMTAPSELPDRFLSAVTGLALSTDGDWLGGTSKDGSARIWDVADLQEPRCIFRLEPKAMEANGVAFSPDRRYLATAHGDNNVRIWRIPTEVSTNPPPTLSEPAVVLPGAENSVAQVSFTSDGRFLISGSDDARVRVWRTDEWQQLDVPRGHNGAVKSVAAHPAPEMADVFATGGGDRRVLLWKIVDDSIGKPELLLRFDELVSSLDFDGEQLAAASLDGSVQVCRFHHPGSRPRRISQAFGVLGVAFGCRHELLVGTEDGVVRRWRNDAGDNPLVIGAHAGEVKGVRGLVFCAEGKTLATSGQDGAISLWCTADGRQLGALGSFGHPIAGFASCRDRSLVAWSTAGKTYIASEWTRGTAPTELDLGWQIPSAFSLSGAGDQLFAGDALAGGLRAWEIPQGKRAWRPSVDGEVICLALASDATQGVASSGAGVWWFDFAAQTQEAIPLDLRDASLSVTCLAIRSDGHSVGIGMADGSIRLYDMHRHRHVATASQHSERVRWIGFSPDDGTLVSGSDDGHVALWDPVMGCQRLALPTAQAVDVIAFSPDGNRFAAGCRDGSVYIWRLGAN